MMSPRMSIFVKICGLTSPDMAMAAVEAGADAVGFVFAESPRQVSVEQARDIADRLPAGIVKVAVMHHPTQAEWDAVATGLDALLAEDLGVLVEESEGVYLRAHEAAILRRR